MKKYFILSSVLIPVTALLVFFPTVSLTAENKPRTQDLSVNAINKDVEVLEARIKKGDKTLPNLYAGYDFYDATEGVPPDFKFYYETPGHYGNPILRVSKTHIGQAFQLLAMP